MKRITNSLGDSFLVPRDYTLKHSDIYGTSLYSNKHAFQDHREFRNQTPIYVLTELHSDDGTVYVSREALGITDIRGMLEMPLEDASRNWHLNGSGDLIIETYYYGTRRMEIAHCKYSSDNLDDFSDKGTEAFRILGEKHDQIEVS